MLTALDENGNIFSLANQDPNEISSIRHKKKFYCPHCREQLMIKAGQVRIIHFSHRKNANCSSAFTEPESIQHLQGKRDLHEFFRKQGLNAHLEVYLKEIQQRPDILITTPNKTYAIEYQCTAIPREQLKERTDRYKEISIIPIWIFGGLPFRKRAAGAFDLNDFLFSLAIDRPGADRSIISYQPETKLIYLLADITPFTSRRVQAAIHAIPLQNISLPFSLQRKKTIFHKQKWIEEKNKWLHNKVRFGNLTDPFLKEVYLSGENPYILPPICGIPTAQMEHFYSHPLEWQFIIYQYCFKRLHVGQKISLKYILQKVQQKINANILITRSFPLDENSSWEQAVIDYMHRLAKREYFRQSGEDLFELRQQIPHPQTEIGANQAVENFYENWDFLSVLPKTNDCLLFGKQEL